MSKIKTTLAGLRRLARQTREQSHSASNDNYRGRNGKTANPDFGTTSSHTVAPDAKTQRPDWFQSIHGTDQ